MCQNPRILLEMIPTIRRLVLAWAARLAGVVPRDAPLPPHPSSGERAERMCAGCRDTGLGRRLSESAAMHMLTAPTY